MAGSNSFSSLSRHSKRGASPTSGAQIPNSGFDDDAHAFVEEFATHMSIGAVDDSPVASSNGTQFAPNFGNEEIPKSVLPFGKKNPFSDLSRVTAAQASVAEQNSDSLATQEDQFAPRSYESISAPKASGSFSGLDRGYEQRSVNLKDRSAKKDIQAIKVVTRLIQGISFNPGSAAANALKSSALRDQLVLADQLGSTLAEAVVADEFNSPWIRAQFIEIAAEMIAKKNENSTDGLTINAQEALREDVEKTINVFRKLTNDQEVANAFDNIGNSQYVPATSESIANDRIAVSMSTAVWELLEKVKATGFSYGLDPVEITQLLAQPIMKIAKDGNITISNLDMKTAHLQGSIRRIAGLIGSEYSGRTAKMLSRTKEAGVDVPPELREDVLCKTFKSEILPEILNAAKKNFQSIEKIAPSLIEDSISQQQTQSSTDKISREQYSR